MLYFKGHPPRRRVFSPLWAAALDYARRGWPVLPLWWPTGRGCACGDPDCGSPGKHPIGPLAPRGVHSATTDPEVIATWWGRFPQANVGIVTGPTSGIIVMDLDPRNGGQVDKLPGPVPVPGVVRTGDGLHFYFAWPPEVERLPKGLPGCPGVDLKGQGGYVVAPPSRHIFGGQYVWLKPPPPALPPCPEWLLELIRRPQPAHTIPPKPGPVPALGTPYGRAALRRELARLAQTPVGNRNNALNRAAFVLGKLVAAGHLEEGMVVGLLTSLGYQIGLGSRETEKTAQSGLKAGMQEGRP